MNSSSSFGPETNRRRSQRVIASVPVVISGETAKGPFSEETETLIINAHGALVNLAAKVTQGQQLKLKSRTHPEAQSCRVAHVGPTVQGKTQMGLEFTAPAPHFWHVAFPPENWSPPPLDKAEIPVKSSKG